MLETQCQVLNIEEAKMTSFFAVSSEKVFEESSLVEGDEEPVFFKLIVKVFFKLFFKLIVKVVPS